MGHLLPRVAPFVLFLLLTGGESLVPQATHWIYPAKVCLVGGLLIAYRKHYTEIQRRFTYLSLLLGLFVFVVWILPEGRYPTIGQAEAWNPYQLGSSQAIIWIAFRLLGTAVVVPIMEELFWRSFLLRYLVEPDFRRIPIGHFTWLSFAATVCLFALEHHRWLVGLFAGICYTLLLYRTKSLSDCILAHAVTNLALGVYVLVTHQWQYW